MKAYGEIQKVNKIILWYNPGSPVGTWQVKRTKALYDVNCESACTMNDTGAILKLSNTPDSALGPGTPYCHLGLTFVSYMSVKQSLSLQNHSVNTCAGLQNEMP